MRIVRPVDITDAVLTSSNVPENDHPIYDSLTTYNVGEKVIVLETHRIYEALRTTNDEYPPDNVLGTTPAWLDLGATNRWRMFDGTTSTLTSIVGSEIVIELLPTTIVNAVTIFGLSAASVTVTVTDSIDGVVYNQTVDLVDNSVVMGWHSYYFEPVTQKSDITLLGLPNYANATITITITGNNPSVGLCVVGNQFRIGTTDYGTGIGTTDYSIKDVDTFGNFYIQPRKFSKRAEYVVTIDSDSVSNVQKVLTKYRTTPLVWVGTETKEETIIYGYYRDFSVILSTFSTADCNIEVEGL